MTKKQLMEKENSHAQSDNNGQQTSIPSSPPVKRSKCPGVRVIGNRIYDSENGKTCHQCRQKTRDFVAGCKNLKKDKLCTIKFCHKCLMNRYGENAEEMALLENWQCPKCRGICNCSFCMKKRGFKPTGMLVHTAKATGFSSVSEMLQVGGLENASSEKIVKDVGVSPVKPLTPKKENVVVSTKKWGNKTSFDGRSDSNLHPPKKMKKEDLKEKHEDSKDGAAHVKKASPRKPPISKEPFEKIVKNNLRENSAVVDKEHSKEINKEVFFDPIKEEKENGEIVGVANKEVGVLDCAKTDNAEGAKPILESRNVRNRPVKLQKHVVEADIPLPQSTDLTTLLGISIPPEDVGHALQFLEFCSAFGKVLDIRKGQPESILRELINGRCGRRAQYSSAVQIHIQLLSLILNNMGVKSPSLSPTNGKNFWLQALREFVSESQSVYVELPPDWFDRGTAGYDELDSSKKLRLLNFLCDEVLGSEKLRNWVNNQTLKSAEREKKARAKVAAARTKEKSVKQKLHDEVAKAIVAKNGAPLSISEHEAVVAQIKLEAAQAHEEMVEAVDMLPKKRQRCDAVRTEPILVDVDGRVYWGLKGCSGESDIFLQELGNWDAVVASKERWLVYNAEQKDEVEKYISFRKKIRSWEVTGISI